MARVFHWKHGWVPLDSVAMAMTVGKKKGMKPGAAANAQIVAAAQKRLNDRKQSRGETVGGATIYGSSPVGKDFRSMTPNQKISATEMMYGTWSKQHQAAIRKWGTPDQNKALDSFLRTPAGAAARLNSGR